MVFVHHHPQMDKKRLCFIVKVKKGEFWHQILINYCRGAIKSTLAGNITNCHGLKTQELHVYPQWSSEQHLNAAMKKQSMGSIQMICGTWFKIHGVLSACPTHFTNGRISGCKVRHMAQMGCV